MKVSADGYEALLNVIRERIGVIFFIIIFYLILIFKALFKQIK